jgi:hypothetical protein
MFGFDSEYFHLKIIVKSIKLSKYIPLLFFKILAYALPFFIIIIIYLSSISYSTSYIFQPFENGIFVEKVVPKKQVRFKKIILHVPNT